MIDKRILQLTPKRLFCPVCGKWHGWTGKTLSSHTLNCSYNHECNYASVEIYVDEEQIHVKSDNICDKFSEEINLEVDFDDVECDATYPVIKIPFTLHSDECISHMECCLCGHRYNCNFLKNCDNCGDDKDEKVFHLNFEFEFNRRYFDIYSQEIRNEMVRKQQEEEAQRQQELARQREAEEAQRQQELARQREAEEAQRQQELARQREAEEAHRQQELARQREAEEAQRLKNKAKEEQKVAEATKKGTSIKTLLYERSPKENMEMVKAWAEKYKPVLKWAVPVAAVYGAYRILNSDEFDLSVNNVADTCEKKLGFRMECLENKKALKELMVLGGFSASAYGAVQALSGLLGNNSEEKEISPDISVEEVETGMNQLQSISKKFSWLQPKTENMLPIALSVILVYVTLHKPKFTGKFANKVQVLTEDFQIKIGLYLELAKDFIQDKFNIDLSDEEEQRKLKVCAFLLVLMGILAFLYGKKVLGDKSAPKEDEGKDKEEINKSVESFVAQAKTVVEKLAPTIYTYLITLFVSKKILMLEEAQEALEERSNEVVVEPVEEAQDKTDQVTAEQAEPEAPAEQQT